MNLKKEFENFIADLSEDKLFNWYSELANEGKIIDYNISLNDKEFFNSNFSSPYNAIQRLTSKYNNNRTERYVMFDGYENLVSFDYLVEKIDIDEIFTYLVDSGEENGIVTEFIEYLTNNFGYNYRGTSFNVDEIVYVAINPKNLGDFYTHEQLVDIINNYILDKEELVKKYKLSDDTLLNMILIDEETHPENNLDNFFQVLNKSNI